MSRTVLYMLRPRGAFHFGERGVGIEETSDFPHSDTLFASIASAWRAIGRDLGGTEPSHGNNLRLLVPFTSETAPFRVSSAFPYAGNVLLFPRPRIGMGPARQGKEIAFLSEGAWQALCQGRLPAEEELIQGGKVWVTAEEREQILSWLRSGRGEQEGERGLEEYGGDPSRIQLWVGGERPPVPRVALDRVTSRSHLYSEGQVRFARGCGLYFWAEFHDLEYRDPLERALRFLEDEGIGGRRTSGHGQFCLSIQDRQWPAIPNATHQVTLSLYRPTRAEVSAGLLNQGRYELIERRGWTESVEGRGWPHRGLRMLAEGSVFPLGTSLTGTIEDVRPVDAGGCPRVPHPVWRYGLALTLPVRLEGVP